MAESPSSSEVMDIGNMINKKGGSVMVQGTNGTNPEHALHQLAQMPPRSIPDPSLERAGSPHGSEHSRYSTPRPGSLDALSAVGNGSAYGSPAPMHAPLQLPNPNMQQAGMAPMTAMPHMNHGMAPGMAGMAYGTQEPAQQPPKAYPCSTCGKAFARRSDLARHERIHSGVRPHVCEYPNCGKQFIQRSALTVHTRVHTGEKPHMCERCGKPFSDSSSLARHRRIHSGKRPYKCPYADCQKTFTRRTTLTRHQNHHTGTVEESVIATAATLAARGNKEPSIGRPVKSEEGSNHPSPMSTPSPGVHRNVSMSPNTTELQASNMSAFMQNHPLPAHMRLGSPTSTASGPYSNNNGIRPTSHPTSYGPPPPTLEPNIEPSQGPGSAVGSPHMSSVGWQSPSHAQSPSHSASPYTYPDPETAYPNSLGQNFYSSTQGMRRPGSAEPGTHRPNEMWAGAQ